MGSFSWTRADHVTNRSNISGGDEYKILIPEKFGGGYIEDTYYDYGRVFDGTDKEADLYGILAYWNHCEGMVYEGDHYPETMDEILKYGNTMQQGNRCIGIEIGCYDDQVDRLEYPLKLVSAEYEGTYEECKGRSYSDPDQGFSEKTWRNRKYERYLRKIFEAEDIEHIDAEIRKIRKK